MLNPPLSNLSPELLIEIIKHLERLYDLQNLLLSDRAFIPLCLPQIYSTWCLEVPQIFDDPHHEKAKEVVRSHAEKLSTTLQWARRICLMIDAWRGPQLRLYREPTAWLFDEPNFIKIMAMFAKLTHPPETLEVRNFKFDDPGLTIHRLRQSFFSRTLVNLIVKNCKDLPLSIFTLSPHLRHVALDNVTYQKGSGGGAFRRKQGDDCDNEAFAPTLKSLDFHASGKVAGRLANSSQALSSLSRLRAVTSSPEDLRILQKILTQSGATLEDLTIIRRGRDDGEFFIRGEVNLAPLTNLRSLSMLSYIAQFDKHRWIVLPYALRTLRTLPFPHQHLEQITFIIAIFNTASTYYACKGHDWSALVDVIGMIAQGRSSFSTPPPGKLHVKLEFVVYAGGEAYRRYPYDFHAMAREAIQTSLGDKLDRLHALPGISKHDLKIRTVDSTWDSQWD